MYEMMKKTQTNKAQGGFTLIELLIVVAIIGILSAIAIPQYSNYQDNAAIAACEQELSAARTALIASDALDDNLDDYNWSACSDTPTYDADAGTITGTPSARPNAGNAVVNIGENIDLDNLGS